MATNANAGANADPRPTGRSDERLTGAQALFRSLELVAKSRTFPADSIMASRLEPLHKQAGYKTAALPARPSRFAS